MLSAKRFFQTHAGVKRKEDSMSSQKKKGMNLERKQNLTGWVFLMPATILIAWMSFYPMIQAFILS